MYSDMRNYYKDNPERKAKKKESDAKYHSRLALTPYFLVLCAYLAIHVIIGKFARDIANYGWLYFIEFYFPKFFPHLIFLIYLCTRNTTTKLKTLFTQTAKFFVILGVVFLTVMLALYLTSDTLIIDISLNGNYEWSWPALLTWNIVFLISYYLTKHKTNDTLYAFTFSVLLISAGGMIYELPIYLRLEWGYYVHSSYPFILGTEFFSFAFLLLMLTHKPWKPSKALYLSLAFYIAHAFMWRLGYLSAFSLDCAWWLPRIIGVLPLLCLSLGLLKTPCVRHRRLSIQASARGTKGV